MCEKNALPSPAATSDLTFSFRAKDFSWAPCSHGGWVTKHAWCITALGFSLELSFSLSSSVNRTFSYAILSVFAHLNDCWQNLSKVLMSIKVCRSIVVHIKNIKACSSQASEHSSMETTDASCRRTLSIDVVHHSHCSHVQNAMLFLKSFFNGFFFFFFRNQEYYSGPWWWCTQSLVASSHFMCSERAQTSSAIALLTHKREVLLLKLMRLVWFFGHL